MNYISYLGEKFTSGNDFPPNSGVKEVYNYLPYGLKQEYYVEGENCEWQFNLADNFIISTIFIYPINGASLTHNLNCAWSREEVRRELGSPDKSGEETESEYLDKSGAWDRYKMVGYYLHIEYVLEGKGIEVETLMLPSDAP